jgi:hypothetical protein
VAWQQQRIAELEAEVARLREYNECLKACNESQARAVAKWWDILAPEYDGDLDFTEMLQAQMTELTRLRNIRDRVLEIVEEGIATLQSQPSGIPVPGIGLLEEVRDEIGALAYGDCPKCDGWAETRNGNPCDNCDATGESIRREFPDPLDNHPPSTVI